MESLAQSEIKQRLDTLKSRHRELDFLISKEALMPSADQIRLYRLKKQKLAIKDEISRLENMLLPDIIA